MKSRLNGNIVALGFLTLAVLAPAAQAHHEANVDSGLVQGFLHPLTGLDHLLAALAAGLWASQRGGWTRTLLPLAFVCALLVGSLLAQSGLAIPFLENGIVLSVVALGLLVAVVARIKAGFAVATIGLFAICHGFAHGTEMPSLALPANWMAGFTLGSAAVLLSGVAFGHLATVVNRASLVRFVGGSIAATGVMLLFV
jgi:urease accessory protein